MSLTTVTVSRSKGIFQIQRTPAKPELTVFEELVIATPFTVNLAFSAVVCWIWLVKVELDTVNALSVPVSPLRPKHIVVNCLPRINYISSDPKVAVINTAAREVSVAEETVTSVDVPPLVIVTVTSLPPFRVSVFESNPSNVNESLLAS